MVRSLISRLRGRRRRVVYGPQVLVSMERPWEPGRVRRFGPVDEVLGTLTVGDLVRSMGQADSPDKGDDAAQQKLLPARYDIQVMSGGESEFRSVDADCPAASLLAEALAEPDHPQVHQLRIRIMPLQPEDEQHRTALTRHSDQAAEDGPGCVLDEEDLEQQMGVAARPPAQAVTAEPPQAPAESSSAGLRGYMRKTDVLRAELLPKIEALDFSGLFVGNFGLQARALDKAHRVSLLDPETANRYLMAANQHRRDGEYHKALHYYKTLVTHDPDNEDFWFLLGKTAADLGRVKQAAHAFSTAKRLGHGRAKEELAALRERHPEVIEKTGDLLSLWRPTYD